MERRSTARTIPEHLHCRLIGDERRMALLFSYLRAQHIDPRSEAGVFSLLAR